MKVARHYVRWTSEERARLAMLWRVGEPAKAIARDLDRTPDSIENMRAAIGLSRRPWAPGLPRLRRRLAWQYGEPRATTILDGRDPATEADVASWNRLGSGRERAA